MTRASQGKHIGLPPTFPPTLIFQRLRCDFGAMISRKRRLKMALFSIDGGRVFWYSYNVAKAVTPYTNMRQISQ
jgi:hypothetical protein